MKRILRTSLIFLVLVLLAIYLLIPNQTTVSRALRVRANVDASYRSLSNTDNWILWWPGDGKQNSAKKFFLEGTEYRLDQHLYNLLYISLRKETDSLTSQLLLLPIKDDSLYIEWKAPSVGSLNPIAKIKTYFKNKELERAMGEVLTSMKSFLEKQQNLYGFEIKEARVKDTVLLASRLVIDSYPSTEQVYGLVRKIKAYVKDKGGKETDYPMLHVDSSKGKFFVMVGIPTERTVPGNGTDIELKRMVRGNILVTEVKGGPHKIKEGLSQLNTYLDDHKRTSPAIPYESLVTDRSVQPDTAQWITRIYNPVI